MIDRVDTIGSYTSRMQRVSSRNDRRGDTRYGRWPLADGCTLRTGIELCRCGITIPMPKATYRFCTQIYSTQVVQWNIQYNGSISRFISGARVSLDIPYKERVTHKVYIWRIQRLSLDSSDHYRLLPLRYRTLDLPRKRRTDGYHHHVSVRWYTQHTEYRWIKEQIDRYGNRIRAFVPEWNCKMAF